MKERVAESLADELIYLTEPDRKSDDENDRKLVSALTALARLEESCRDVLVQTVWSLIADYKRDDSVRSAAALCYPAIAIPSQKVVEAITSLVRSPPSRLEGVVVQMPGILSRKCKTSIDFVIACVGSLGALRDALVELHKRFFKRPVTSEVEAYVTEIREGIEQITEMTVTFSEFINPADAVGLKGRL